MKLKRKTDPESPVDTRDDTDEVIDEVLAELREEDGIMEEIDAQVRKARKRQKIRRIVIAVLILLILVTIFLVIYLETYTSSRIVTTYDVAGSGNVNYEEFGRGILRYSKDGIVLLDRRGDEKWNQSYQIRNPILATYEDQAAAVADKGGNTIVVLDRDGLKGEMQTTLPVEKVVVSGQGIVCAVLKSEPSPKSICYAAAGNPLVELATSLAGTGYPLDVSISGDGTMLLVSYLSVQDGQLSTKVRYYDFSGEKDSQEEYAVTADDYPGMAAASAFFMNASDSVVVGDDRLLFYTGAAEPELAKTVVLDKKIKSVFHDQRYVGLVLKNEGRSGYELRLYNTSGRQLLSEEFSGDYSNAKISGSQVILYDGRKCNIFTRTGLHRFEGEVSSNIMEIIPVLGVNKYIVMNTGGMEVIRLVK